MPIEKTDIENTVDDLNHYRENLVKVQIALHNVGEPDDSVIDYQDDIDKALHNIENAIIKIDNKIDEMTNTKLFCDNCGAKIEKYPHNGRPLIEGDVCDTCNHIVIFHKLLSAMDRENVGMTFQEVCDYIAIKEQVRKELGIEK